MLTEKHINVFTYYWTTDRNIIRCYGMLENSETVCLNIKNFKRWMYIKPPQNKIIDFAAAINFKEKAKRATNIFNLDIRIENKRELYFAGDREVHTYIKVLFKTFSDFYMFRTRLKLTKTNNSFTIDGDIYTTQEDFVGEILQFTSSYDIPTSGWICASVMKAETVYTTCGREYDIFLSEKIIKIKKEVKYLPPPKPVVLSYDIECYSSNYSAMPNAQLPSNVVFQISAILNGERFLFTLIGKEENNYFIEGVCVYTFDTERSLLISFGKFVKKSGANVIIGYNIFGFDIKYLMDRAKYNNCYIDFCNQQFKTTAAVKEKKASWSSSAYGYNEFIYFDIEGRLIIDLLPVVRRAFKLVNYRLDTVAGEILGARKDPIKPKDIFQSYEAGVLGNDISKLILVGKYCVKDSELVYKMFEKMAIWVELSEMATIFNVPIEYLFMRGQQIKAFSQIYKYCTQNNIIVQRNAYSTMNSTYEGATVFDSRRGLYDNVVTLDFASLYPSIIIAFNIDYSTYIREEDWDKYKEEEYNEFKWEEHSNCIHCESAKSLKKKTICCSHVHRFLKSPRGVIPIILENLLSKRKEVKKELKAATDELVKILLDKRQLGYKVSANSIYGMFGVTSDGGMLPLLPAAMVVTYNGRRMVALAAAEIQQSFGGRVIYGDTDSNFVKFNDKKTTQELWDYCLYVEKHINSKFPPPIRLEFEPRIYKKLLMLSKKRYITLSCDREGNIVKEIDSKGSVLVRRDSSILVKVLYKTLVRAIFDGAGLEDIIEKIEIYMSLIFRRAMPLSVFIKSSSLKKDDEYKFPPLPKCTEERNALLKRKRMTEVQYYEKLPGHVQLARRMRARGQDAPAGARIEYVVTNAFFTNEKKSKKIEEVEYFKRHRDILRIDYLCYVKQLINPIDDLIETAFGKTDVMKKIYNERFKKYKLCEEIKTVFTPEIVINK
jgi:DNA polymerase elongation subunit (family B)